MRAAPPARKTLGHAAPELWSKVVYGGVETCRVSLLKSSCERHGFGKRSTPHTSNDTVVSLATPAPISTPLTELVRSGARRLIEAAIRVQFEEYPSSFGHEKLPDGRQQAVRNGHLPRAKDSHRARRGGRAGPEGAQPLGLPGAVPFVGGARPAFGAARASMRRFRGCTCTGCPPKRGNFSAASGLADGVAPENAPPYIRPCCQRTRNNDPFFGGSRA